MTKREKILAGLVGGTVAVLLNFFLISFFAKNHRALKQDLANKQKQLTGLNTLIADRDFWEQRGAWIASTQPKLEDPARAGVDLMEEVRKLAKQHVVLIPPETVSLGSPMNKDHYTSVHVVVETRSTWDALINFLTELQGRDKFIVVESADLQKYSSDATQMQGKLTIAKWYAPK